MDITEDQPEEKVRAFHELPMPVRNFVRLGKAHYRIYESGKCKEVEAETAAEALKASGVETAQRIEREVHGNELLITLKKLLGDKAAAPEAAPPGGDMPPPAADAAAAATPAA